MADIPSISITNEFSDDDDKTDLLIDNNIATDCENLESDSDSGRVTFGSNLAAFSKPKGKSKKDILTDCEDLEGSDSEEDPSRQDNDTGITLEEFLDQGTTNETTRYNGQNESTYDGPRGKTTGRSSPMPSNLSCNPDIGGLTDCEDLDASGEEDSEGEDIREIELSSLLDENNTVESHDNVRSVLGQHHLTTTDSSDSSSESGDDHTPCNSANKKFLMAQSDTENVLLSDYETQLASCPKRSVITDLAEDEVITVELSDADECDRSEMDSSRCIDVQFKNVTKDYHKPGTPQFSKFLAVLQDPNEGLTDVENLNSSDDDDDEDDKPGGLRIPPAVVRTDNAYLTDVEDMEGDVENDEIDEGVEDLEDNMTLPKAVRQLILVHETTTGAPQSRVIPLADNMSLAADVGYHDKGLTDTEDLSDVNEELYDISEYLIESLPDIESGKITSSDRVSNSLLSEPNKGEDPITDTEEMTDFADTRKKRHRHRHSNRHRHKLAVVNNDEEGTTDVEELILADQPNRRYSYQPGQATGTPMLTVNHADDAGGHTDVEVLSGDEDTIQPRGRRMQRNSSPNILNKSDWFNSAEATKETMQEDGKRCNNYHLQMNLPRLRKLSPTPDAGQTDIEELSRSGDDDDEDYQEYCRGETPAAVHRQLDENNSTTHDRNVSVFDERSERLNIKGHHDIQEALTDTEYLEDDSRK